MGRRKIQIESIADERIRRVTFKKRRIGLLKKAIQLSKLTNAVVELKVYQEEDQSLIEYYSKSENDFKAINKTSEKVYEFSRFTNRHYDLVANLEEKVTKHGHLNILLEEQEAENGVDYEDHLEGINMLQLFSLAKRTTPNKPVSQTTERAAASSSSQEKESTNENSAQVCHKRQKTGDNAPKEAPSTEELAKLHDKAQDLVAQGKTEALAYEQKLNEVKAHTLSLPT